MKRILAAVSIVALLASPAHSAWGQWDNIGNWSIEGESQTGVCLAMAHYQSGKSLGISFGKKGVDLIVGGIVAEPLTAYEVIVHATNGGKGVLPGSTDASGTVISFRNINKATVRGLARARGITIRGVGGFDLTGSRKAMASAWECFETLNSI